MKGASQKQRNCLKYQEIIYPAGNVLFRILALLLKLVSYSESTTQCLEASWDQLGLTTPTLSKDPNAAMPPTRHPWVARGCPVGGIRQRRYSDGLGQGGPAGAGNRRGLNNPLGRPQR